MIKLFGKRNNKHKAAVFIDYEHWFYSLGNNFDMKPDVKAFYKSISERFEVCRFFVFGDFSRVPIKYEVERIRETTTDIIDTQNPSLHQKKDFTDFIMLDSIYRCVDSNPEIGTYIFFTGDGHFSSVGSYLSNSKHRKLIVYGVAGSVSSRLKAVAAECYEIPLMNQERIIYYRMIIDNFEYLSKRETKVNATFNSTVRNVAQYNKVKQSEIAGALQDLIDKEVILKQTAQINRNRKITVLNVNWERAIKEGLWSPDKSE